jgi:hypothetical protein
MEKKQNLSLAIRPKKAKEATPGRISLPRFFSLANED